LEEQEELKIICMSSYVHFSSYSLSIFFANGAFFASNSIFDTIPTLLWCHDSNKNSGLFPIFVAIINAVLIMKAIHWGIIGAGNVCERKSGPAFYKIEHSSLTAVMRRDADKAKDFALRHGVPKYYTDADSLIYDADIDAVYVATPPSLHKEYTIRALKAGKPVYVEKPMAMNYHECTEMIKASQESGQKLFVAYYRRALPYFLKIKELLQEGAIGNVLSVGVKYFRPPLTSDFTIETHTWRVNQSVAGEGYFYDLAPHTLDILDFLLGEISDAKGFSHSAGHLYEVKDTVTAILRFQSGVTGVGERYLPFHRYLRRKDLTYHGHDFSMRIE
jgi:predicted dehydrogenase